MAYYDFKCEACRKHFEVKQSFAEHSQKHLPKCPVCGSGSVVRQIGTVHVQTTKKS